MTQKSEFEACFLPEIETLDEITYRKNISRVKSLRPGTKRRSNAITREVEASIKSTKRKYKLISDEIESIIKGMESKFTK